MTTNHELSSAHYGDAYFAWQKRDGELAAALDGWKFAPFILPGDTVLDFGCGGGYLLRSLNCAARYGVEINPAARMEALPYVNAAATIEELPANVKFDKIISHHALEHVEHPIDVLRKLRKQLKPGGLIIVVVPSETWRDHKRYERNDINQHLYTWTPQLLGNLFSNAGYEVQKVSTLCHRWLPYAHGLHKILPRPVFHLACRVAAFFRGERQLVIVAANCSPDAFKPESSG